MSDYYNARAHIEYTPDATGEPHLLLVCRPTVAERQAEALDKYAALGASCGVLVSFGAKCCGVVPWAAWRAMKEIFGRKYLRAEDVEGMGWKFMMFDARGLCQLLHGLSLYQMKQKI